MGNLLDWSQGVVDDEWSPDLDELLTKYRLISSDDYDMLSQLSTKEVKEMLLSRYLFLKKGLDTYEEFCDMLCKNEPDDPDILDFLSHHPSEIARYCLSKKETKLSSRTLPESEDSVIALEFRNMTLMFKKAQTLQKYIGEAGGVISSEFCTVTIPPGAIVGKALCTGYTVYEYQPEESKGVKDDTEVTDIIVLHPCGTEFEKNVEIKMNSKFSSSQQSSTCLLYEGPDAGFFSITTLHDIDAEDSNIAPFLKPIIPTSPVNFGVEMTASLSLSSIDISTKHFCKLFACLFGCTGHCYRALAFGRWARGDSPRNPAMIDLHFTSSKSSFVSSIQQCNEGRPQLLNYNATIFFSRLAYLFQSDPIKLEIANVSPRWKLISTPRNIQEQELTQARTSPEEYCTCTFILEKKDEDADDPWLEVHLTGGRTTDCSLVLKECTSSPASHIGASDASLSGETTLNSPVTDDQIRQLHLKIEAFWKKVANFLGPTPLTDDEIEQIRISTYYDDNADRCKAMLNKWRKKQMKKNGKSGTVGDVLKALLHNDVGLQDVAKDVFGEEAMDRYHSKD